MPNPPVIAGPNGPITACVMQEDEKLYHRRSGEFMSSHQLKEFRKCPAFFIRQRMGMVPREDKPSFLVGRAAHCLIIEGRAEYDRRYMTGGPINAKTGKPYGVDSKAHAEWAAQQDREVLTSDQAALVERMAGAAAAHGVASRWFSGGVGEGVVRRTFGGGPCQIRIDCLHQNYGLVDLKTTADIDWFESDARKFGYLHQLAFYRDVLADAAGTKPDDIPCRIVAVEKAEPFRCGVWLVAPATLEDCSLQNAAALEDFARCEASGVWPTRYEEERVFHV
jgi:hypothetical protein